MNILKRTKFLTLILVPLFLITACQGNAVPQATSSPQTSGSPVVTEGVEGEEGEDDFIGMPNPASFYCQEMGYAQETKETEEGTEGICVFHDGNKCEEWDFLAGRCGQQYSFCELQGYDLEEAGNIGNCRFDDGSSCPEYLFFIRECMPPDSENGGG